MTREGWSTSDDVRKAVGRRWRSGELLTAYARGEPFPEISVVLKGPKASEVASNLPIVRSWREGLVRDAGKGRRASYSLSLRSVGGRSVGHNELPARAEVSTFDQAWRLLGVSDEVARFDAVLAATQAADSAWLDWVERNPRRSLDNAREWELILATARWLREQSGRGRYLREIAVPGADTKFVERHRGVLAALLDALPDFVTPDPGRSRGRDFALHYGFRQSEPLVRLRAAPGVLPVLGGVTELGVRVEELSGLPLEPGRVMVVENEASYLALPLLDDTLVVFGSGYIAGRLGKVSWLEDCAVDYWGDIDTHGFAILHRLRTRLPHVRSVLMDRATLLVHEDRWVVESTPTRGHLDRLTLAESDLYRDLVEDSFGFHVRLEQERVSWDRVYAALDGA